MHTHIHSYIHTQVIQLYRKFRAAVEHTHMHTQILHTHIHTQILHTHMHTQIIIFLHTHIHTQIIQLYRTFRAAVERAKREFTANLQHQLEAEK
jgi:hypothetical protein